MLGSKDPKRKRRESERDPVLSIVIITFIL